MLPYIMGPIGIIIALIAASSSPYAAFHVRQAMKITVCSVVAGLAAALLAFTVLVPLAAAVFVCIMAVLSIIAFFQVCDGKAKEPAIIKGFKFLK